MPLLTKGVINIRQDINMFGGIVMLFAQRATDYEVVGLFRNNLGQPVAEKRICHNMSKKEAKMQMKVHLLRAYSETIDLDSPVQIDVHPTNK